ncbi:hypothetical protein [uncultured Microbulbifer sp.]|uniref:hypothetical protein n=1 Tax=uncultured Microbulbifer sp. TaxID=348147 RepID=UPI0026154252|nr:hypothetical protein [uncultured Microbulbifer sp.]
MRKSRSIDVSPATSFAPVAGVLAAFFILGEIQTHSQFIDGAILMIGLAICLYAIYLQHEKNVTIHDSLSEDEVAPMLNAECRAGFKYV